MLYIEYETFKRRYHKLQKEFDGVLSKKERIIAQKKSTDKINEKLDEIRKTLDDRKKLMNDKEQELRSSKEAEDVIYRMKYIDNASVNTIRHIVHYSETEVYRKLAKINKNLKNI